MWFGPLVDGDDKEGHSPAIDVGAGGGGKVKDKDHEKEWEMERQGEREREHLQDREKEQTRRGGEQAHLETEPSQENHLKRGGRKHSGPTPPLLQLEQTTSHDLRRDSHKDCHREGSIATTNTTATPTVVPNSSNTTTGHRERKEVKRESHYHREKEMTENVHDIPRHSRHRSLSNSINGGSVVGLISGGGGGSGSGGGGINGHLANKLHKTKRIHSRSRSPSNIEDLSIIIPIFPTTPLFFRRILKVVYMRWFFGFVSEELAEAYLTGLTPGSFLVRLNLEVHVPIEDTLFYVSRVSSDGETIEHLPVQHDKTKLFLQHTAVVFESKRYDLPQLVACLAKHKIINLDSIPNGLSFQSVVLKQIKGDQKVLLDKQKTESTKSNFF
eukprot:TRINITY_DN2649_c1_g1_i1.p1 TRINITY_DN2649_c1_g1~~TRINITY_DN2649_c1_g1_i1.p1  ORF type:complete len:385 (-),score=115.32 TRINITY_DN2649_c1_g1_i1:340-1494(-)